MGVLLVFLVALGCDDPPPASEHRPPVAERSATADDEDVVAERSAWPTNVSDLRESVDAFESVESCRASLRDRVPVELADVLSDLGYDPVVDDVCFGLRALAERDPAICDELSVTPARKGCRRRLALLTGDPFHCPEDAVVAGREPTCLAWARRDPGLCRGVAEHERPRCEAVLAGDAEPCDALVGDARARCVAEVDRYGGTLPEGRNESEVGELDLALSLEATVRRDGAPAGAAATVPVDADRGVHVAIDGCDARIVIGSPRPGLGVAHPEGEAALEIPLRIGAEVPIDVPLGVTGAHLRVRLPNGDRADATAGARGHVTVTRFAPLHGAAVGIAIDGTLSLAPGDVTVSGELLTFVRDVDPIPDRCRQESAEVD